MVSLENRRVSRRSGEKRKYVCSAQRFKRWSAKRKVESAEKNRWNRTRFGFVFDVYYLPRACDKPYAVRAQCNGIVVFDRGKKGKKNYVCLSATGNGVDVLWKTERETGQKHVRGIVTYL